jgi:hypothetical protein
VVRGDLTGQSALLVSPAVFDEAAFDSSLRGCKRLRAAIISALARARLGKDLSGDLLSMAETIDRRDGDDVGAFAPAQIGVDAASSRQFLIS